jgi:hypothetical protein
VFSSTNTEIINESVTRLEKVYKLAREQRDRLVKHGVTGLLVELSDMGGLAQALLQLIRDPKLRRRMGEAGRARIQDHALPRVLAEMEAVYSRYLGHHLSSGRS